MSLALLVIVFAGCGADGGSELDSTPQRLDGTESHEFEQEDVDRAAGASDAVKEYCADSVSEAQRLGCESHVTEDEIPWRALDRLSVSGRTSVVDSPVDDAPAADASPMTVAKRAA